MAETSYAECGDLSLAYQVFGDGPVQLVVAGSYVSHVELLWAQPEFKAFFEQLSTFCAVVLFAEKDRMMVAYLTGHPRGHAT